jgi:hypothetical protein
MTRCGAYFAITTQCLRLRNRPQEDAQLIQSGSAAKDHLLKEATWIGNAVGITPDAMASRLRNEMTRTYLKIADCCRSDINVE